MTEKLRRRSPWKAEAGRLAMGPSKKSNPSTVLRAGLSEERNWTSRWVEKINGKKKNSSGETRPWWRRPLPALRLTEKWQQGQKLNRAIRENEIGLSEEQNLAKLNRALVAATLAGADTHVRKWTRSNTWRWTKKRQERRQTEICSGRRNQGRGFYSATGKMMREDQISGGKGKQEEKPRSRNNMSEAQRKLGIKPTN
jgi:hypothetical protein